MSRVPKAIRSFREYMPHLYRLQLQRAFETISTIPNPTPPPSHQTYIMLYFSAKNTSHFFMHISHIFFKHLLSILFGLQHALIAKCTLLIFIRWAGFHSGLECVNQNFAGDFRGSNDFFNCILQWIVCNISMSATFYNTSLVAILSHVFQLAECSRRVCSNQFDDR